MNIHNLAIAFVGVLAVDFAGNPLDILDGFYNDASQTYDGHQGDDNYQGHGRENLHDYERASYLVRAGIVDALIEAEALRRIKTAEPTLAKADYRLSVCSVKMKLALGDHS